MAQLVVFAWFAFERGNHNDSTRANTQRPLEGSGLGGLLYYWGLSHHLDTRCLQTISAASFGGSEYPLLQCLVSELQVTPPGIPRVKTYFQRPMTPLVLSLNQSPQLKLAQGSLDSSLRDAECLDQSCH